MAPEEPAGSSHMVPGIASPTQSFLHLGTQQQVWQEHHFCLTAETALFSFKKNHIIGQMTTGDQPSMV